MNIETNICMGCLSVDRKLQPVNEECKQTLFALLNVFEHSEPITLCFECLAMLRRSLSFKQQVKHAYAYLFSYLTHNKTLKSLSKLNLTKTVHFDNLSDNSELSNHYIIYKGNVKTKHRIKSSISDDLIKYENQETNNYDQETNNYDQETNNYDQETNDYDKKCDSSTEPLAFIKVEDVENGFEDQDTKSELDSDDEPLKLKSKKHKRRRKDKNDDSIPRRRRGVEQSGVVTDPRVARKLRDLNMGGGHISLVLLTWEQVEEERGLARQSVSFTGHAHRCDSCIVGFNHVHKLEEHNKKHSSAAGTEVCDVCSIRCKTRAALASHRRRHRARWVCSYCGARYSVACVAADHCARSHATPTPTHRCAHCTHTATSQSALKMHLKSHSTRPECNLCGKTFIDKNSLRTHAFVHRGEKEHACSVCGKRFMFKKQREIHETTHKEHQHLYCHQCDVSFKNQTSYYQHIKYNLKHIDPTDIKYACKLCDKKFVKAKRLEEHNLAVHLKLTPIKCTTPNCTFAGASRAALRSHIRLVHRGARSRTIHVCHKCGHTYKSKQSLDSHLRSHNTSLLQTKANQVDATA